MIEYAKSEDIKRIEGQVLRENKTMLSVCRELGFRMTEGPSDEPSCW